MQPFSVILVTALATARAGFGSSSQESCEKGIVQSHANTLQKSPKHARIPIRTRQSTAQKQSMLYLLKDPSVRWPTKIPNQELQTKPHESLKKHRTRAKSGKRPIHPTRRGQHSMQTQSPMKMPQMLPPGRNSTAKLRLHPIFTPLLVW